MSGQDDRTITRNPSSDDDIDAIASEFEEGDFAPAELVTIRETRRHSPRLGETAFRSDEFDSTNSGADN